MKHSQNKANTLIISIFFICLLFDWQKNLTALEFWRNVYVCGGCREEKISQTINSLWTSQR